MFDLESFFAGVLIGMLLYALLGGLAYGFIYRKIRRSNPYAPKKAY